MPKKIKEQINLLELTPVRKFEHKTNEEGLIDVMVPRFKSEFMQRFIPKSRESFIRANLDEIGTEVWQLIDGNNKVDDIANMLSTKLGDKVAPVHERLYVFFTHLHNNGFIFFKELKKEK